jgi:hypothetical protein
MTRTIVNLANTCLLLNKQKTKKSGGKIENLFLETRLEFTVTVLYAGLDDVESSNASPG